MVDVDKSLTNALLKLCNEKPLIRISVSELVKEAKIGRATFYLYYQNLDALIKQIESDIIDQYQDISSAYTYNNETDKALWYKSAIKPLFSMTKEKVLWINLLCGPGGDPSFAYKVKQFILTDNQKKHAQARINCDQTIFEYNVAATEGMFFHWLQTNARLDVNSFTDQIFLPIQNLLNRQN